MSIFKPLYFPMRIFPNLFGSVKELDRIQHHNTGLVYKYDKEKQQYMIRKYIISPDGIALYLQIRTKKFPDEFNVQPLLGFWLEKLRAGLITG